MPPLQYPNLIITARLLQIIATATKSNNHNYVNTATMLFSNNDNWELHLEIKVTVTSCTHTLAALQNAI